MKHEAEFSAGEIITQGFDRLRKAMQCESEILKISSINIKMYAVLKILV